MANPVELRLAGTTTDVNTSNPLPVTAPTALLVGGPAADDAAATGNPVLVGGKYEASLNTVEDGDASWLKVDANGRLLTAGAGTIAAGATDSGNPVKVGGVYNTTVPSYANGQRGDLQVNASGYLRVGVSGVEASSSDGFTNTVLYSLGTIPTNSRLVMQGGYNFNGSTWDRLRGNTTGLIVIDPNGWSYAPASGGIVNTTTAVTIKAAAGASVRNYLKSLTISHDALGAATEIAVRDGAGGTVLWRSRLQTTAVEDRAINFDTPLYSTANTLLEVLTITAVTGRVYVNAQGYTAP